MIEVTRYKARLHLSQFETKLYLHVRLLILENGNISFGALIFPFNCHSLLIGCLVCDDRDELRKHFVIGCGF